jgi:trimethylamine--corrinoid protein Co-methyltransferase
LIEAVNYTTRLELIPEKSVQDIHTASLWMLENTGLIMPLSGERQDQASDLGLEVDYETQRVRFPAQVVEEAIRQAPASYTLCARDPENDLRLDGKHGYLSLDGSGTQVLDLETGEARNSIKADLEAAARLADGLPQIAFLWPTVSAQNCLPSIQPLHELAALLANSSKHVQAMTAVDALNARGSLEIAAQVAGGYAELGARPIISNFQCSVSPLSYDKDALEAAFIFAEAGVPVGFLCMPIGCATAPATVAGIVAQANAEVLGGMALLELFYPGAPTFYGSSATMLELHSGGVTCGGPEDFLLQAAACQMARFYGVPCSAGTFATSAKASDWHAGVENAISGAVSQFSGADMMCGAGLLYAARIFSFEQLVMDCEIFSILRAVTQGFLVNEETLALNVIQRVGPGKHFMASRHTREHMRQVWQPEVIERSTSREEWIAKGKPAARDRAREKARRILASHQPAPLDCIKEIDEIIAAYERMSAKN